MTRVREDGSHSSLWHDLQPLRLLKTPVFPAESASFASSAHCVQSPEIDGTVWIVRKSLIVMDTRTLRALAAHLPVPAQVGRLSADSGNDSTIRYSDAWPPVRLSTSTNSANLQITAVIAAEPGARTALRTSVTCGRNSCALPNPAGSLTEDGVNPAAVA